MTSGFVDISNCPCFRDEDARADRSQLSLSAGYGVAFATQEDVLKSMSGCYIQFSVNFQINKLMIFLSNEFLI